MKKYTIKVNGVAYEVEVEDQNGIGGTQMSNQPVIQNVSESNAAPVAAAAPKAPEVSVPSDAILVDAPMPGMIIGVKVKDGQEVHSGDVLVILEAMKMENEIVAPKDGKVVAVHCTENSAVEAGDKLISIQ